MWLAGQTIYPQPTAVRRMPDRNRYAFPIVDFSGLVGGWELGASPPFDAHQRDLVEGQIVTGGRIRSR